MLCGKHIKLLFIACLLFLNSHSTLYAQNNPEIEALNARAEQLISAGDIDGAINAYQKILSKGEFWAADRLSKIYNNYKNNYFKAGVWCYVAIEKFASENANCENLSFFTTVKEDDLKAARRLAIQCIATNFQSCEELSTRFEKEINIYYSKYCTVSDPKDTTFNVRTQPNGKIIRKIENGFTAIKTKSASDKNGRQWILIIDDFYGFDVGWVAANFVKCNTRERL